MRTTIWTKAARELLYEQLVVKFGPHKTWTTNSPDGFEEFCETFATLVDAGSFRAVRQQVRFAVDNGNNARNWRNVVQNMAAAFDAGFIDNSYFPQHVTASDPELVTAGPQ